LNGLCGATQPANIAQKPHTSATAAATMAVGDERNECQTSPPKNRPQTPGVRGAGGAPDPGAGEPTLVVCGAEAAALSST